MNTIDDDKKYEEWTVSVKHMISDSDSFEDEICGGLDFLNVAYSCRYDSDDTIVVTLMVKNENQAYRCSEKIEQYLNDWWDADAIILGVDRVKNKK